jgi:hypothetical protein
MDRMVMSYLNAFEILLKNLAGDTKEKTGSFLAEIWTPNSWLLNKGAGKNRDFPFNLYLT